MAHELLQRVVTDALEGGSWTPDALRAQLETAIERFAHGLAEDTEIRYGWCTEHEPPDALSPSLEEAEQAPHPDRARLRGFDERAGFSFDVEDYGMGESTTIGLRIRRRNLAALKIPITEVRTRRSAFLVEIAPGIYRFGGCALRPADPVGADEALSEAGELTAAA